MSTIIFATSFNGAWDPLWGSTVESDKLFRTLSFVGLAREDYQNLKNEDKVLLNLYAAGVSAYLLEASAGQTGGTLPLDFDLLFGLSTWSFSTMPWEAYHTLALVRLVTYKWGYGWEDSLKKEVFAAATHFDAESLWFNVEKTISELQAAKRALIKWCSGSNKRR